MSDMLEVLPALRLELSSLEKDEARLRAEKVKIESRLQLVVDKVEKIRGLLPLYEGDVEQGNPKLFEAPVADPVPVQLHPMPDLPKSTNSGTPLATNGRPISKATALRNAVTSHLQERGKAHRQELLELLIAKGIMGHEKVPMASLAAYLSDNRNIFEPDGKGFFSLRPAGSVEPQPAADYAAGSVEAAELGSDPSPAFNPDTVEQIREEAGGT